MLQTIICPPPLVSAPDAQITSACLFFDKVYLLPTVDWPDRALKADAWLAGHALMSQALDHQSYLQQLKVGEKWEGGLNLPDDLPPSLRIWFDSAESLNEIADLHTAVSPLREDGMLMDLPELEH